MNTNIKEESKKFTNLEIVKRLIGPIRPVAETRADEERFENLKEMCDLVNKLVTEIDDVAYENKNRQEYSVKKSADYASNFITKTLGIKE